jgi:iron-sulfur cluster assembly protein
MSTTETTRTGETTITLTDSAASQVIKLLQEGDLTEHALRVFVSGGGCSGFQYGMALDDQLRDTDYRFHQQGVEIVIDPLSMDYLVGATIDFEDSLMGGGFRIENPNAVASCGCGNSFRTGKKTKHASHAHAGGSCNC